MEWPYNDFANELRLIGRTGAQAPVLSLVKTAAEGHWRKLKAGQKGHNRQGGVVYGKTWVRGSKKRPSKARRAPPPSTDIDISVPPPRKFHQEGDVSLYAAPSGRFVFAVHDSIQRRFEKMTKDPAWPKNPKVLSFMTDNEAGGKFSIFRVG
jgi:hypothetical protein